jgi:hypothetical protein
MGRSPVNKTSVFCKAGAVLDGLQKLCQKAFGRTKKKPANPWGLQALARAWGA